MTVADRRSERGSSWRMSASRRSRLAAVGRFARRNPLGAAGALVIIVMVRAGGLCRRHRALQPGRQCLRPAAPAAEPGELVRHRPVRPRCVLAHRLRRAHRAARRIRVVVRRRHLRARARGGERLFRRPGRFVLPARARRVHGVPADHPGARGDRDLRDRRAERDHRDHDPVHPALRPRRALERTRDPRDCPISTRRAPTASATPASFCATWYRT